MHRVASAGNAANPARRKERKLTYVISDSDDSKHCAGVNCIKVSADETSGKQFLFSGSRDGTLKRWNLDQEVATCSATFESHVDWVNDAVVTGGSTLVSCSSDTTLKTWNAFSDGVCTKTFRQHSDYVTSLAAARHSNVVASGGLSCEVFIWDLEAATVPVNKVPSEVLEEGRYDPAHKLSGGIYDRSTNANSGIATPLQGYTPVPAKGHKQSVYALAINDAGNVLVSGGTEKAVRVWDPRTGAKQMKLKGHTDNIRTLLLDPTGRLCLSGSSDSIIRLWDLGQQRCVHSYAVHTDSVWTMASNSSFSHVYSGGKDLSVYLTDLASRESTLLLQGQYPVLQLAVQDDDWLWVATTDSSIHKWPSRERMTAKLQKANSFVAGSLPFSRARAWVDGSAPAPLYTEPTSTIQGSPGIVQHAILNDKRHVLTKDTSDNVKLWELTRGTVVKDFGKISLEEKEKELFEMVCVPSWFTMDTRFGSISLHLETPACFAAEIYAVDLHVPGASEESKLNLGQETIRGLFKHWLARRKQRSSSHMANGESTGTDHGHGRSFLDSDGELQTVFEFSTTFPPSIVTEGSQGGPWRKKITDLNGTEDEKEIPRWCIDCVVHGQVPPRDHSKCSFFLHPYEGTTLQVLTQGKLSAPRILRIQKVINYVVDKLVLERPVDDHSSDGAAGNAAAAASNPQMPGNVYGTFRQRESSRNWHVAKPHIEILCNQQVLAPDMSLATVRAYIWKKQEDLCLYYRSVNRS